MAQSSVSEPRRASVAAAPPAVIGLSLLIAALAAVATVAGLLAPGDAATSLVESVRGERVELYGQGVYRHDSLFKGASNVGTDLITLIVGVPLLLTTAAVARRGSQRAALLLVGALAWFLYVYATYALYVAFNELFLVYVALFSASLFALVLLVRSLTIDATARHVPDHVRGRTAALLIAGGVTTLGVWALPIAAAIAAGDAPKLLDSSTTMVTEALDLAVITPCALLGGWLLWRKRDVGYELAVPLLVLLVLLGPTIIAQTVSQLAAGIEFTPGEVIGPIAGFVILGAAAAWCLTGILRSVSDSPAD